MASSLAIGGMRKGPLADLGMSGTVNNPCFVLISHTQAGSTNGGTSVTTPAIDTTGSNLLVAVYAYNINPPTITDSQGNVWTIADQRNNSNTHEVIAYSFNPSTSATHTVSISGANTFPSVVFASFSGSAASPLDQATGAVSNIAGPITPSQANELIISGIASLSTLTPTVSGVTLIGGLPTVAGQNISVGMGYTPQVAATAVTATWNGGFMNSSSIVSFKAQCSVPSGSGGFSNILNTTIAPGSNRGAVKTYNPTGGF